MVCKHCWLAQAKGVGMREAPADLTNWMRLGFEGAYEELCR